MTAINYDIKMEAPQGVTLRLEGRTIFVKGPKGESKRTIDNPKFDVVVSGQTVELKCKSKKTSVYDKMFANTIAAHLKNMFKGVVEGYNAKVKVLSGHFPITPAVEGSVVSVKNFLGEKTPRKVTMPAGVKVVLQGDTFVVDGADREIVAQAAAKIENMTRITDKDRRVFQDGCYIIQKAANKKI